MKRTLVVLTLMALKSSGCGEESTDSAGGLLVNTDDLWRARPVSISVCWENADDASPAERMHVRDVVEAGWGSSPAIAFRGWTECDETSTGIRILIDARYQGVTRVLEKNGRWLSGRHLDGHIYADGTRWNVRLNLSYRDWRWCRNSETNRVHCLRAVALHEFGHVLGFWHAEERADYSPGSATIPIDRNRNGVWDHAEEACASQWRPAFNDYGGALVLDGRYDVDSIMSYCGHPSDAPWTWRTTLSSGDRASLRKFYLND